MTSVTTSGSPVAAALKAGDHCFVAGWPADWFEVSRVRVHQVHRDGNGFVTDNGAVVQRCRAFDSQAEAARYLLANHIAEFENAESEAARYRRLLDARARLKAIAEERL